MRLVIGGDVMLGRLVGAAIQQYGPTYPLQEIAGLMRRGDITLVNLECAITNSQQLWTGAPKAFYFGAPCVAIQSLLHAGINLVSLANNHILDFDSVGLQDTCMGLKNNNIYYAGAGINYQEAHFPAILTVNHMKFGLVAFCDHQKDFAANENRPGIAYINFSDEEAALNQLQAGYQRLQDANVEYPILSLHWGPNMVERPSNQFQRIAHAAIAMGYKLLFGHSAHVFHGIEIYQQCPIIYAAGDLVDDYCIDPYFNNDHQLLFEISIIENQATFIKLYPVLIHHCRVEPAADRHFAFIAQRMQYLCREMGTAVDCINNSYLQINL